MTQLNAKNYEVTDNRLGNSPEEALERLEQAVQYLMSSGDHAGLDIALRVMQRMVLLSNLIANEDK